MKVSFVVLLVVLASVTQARPAKRSNGGDGQGDRRIRIGGIQRVSKKQLERFRKLFVDVAEEAKTIMQDASTNTAYISELDDGQKVLILDQIVQRVFGLGTEVKRLMVRGKMILIRIFISGFDIEDRCERFSADDVKKKRDLMSNDSLREKRDMCLVRSVGDIIHSFEVASMELENEALAAAANSTVLPPRCDKMTTYEDKATARLDNQLFRFLHEDFACLRHRIDFYAANIISLSEQVEADSPDAVRMAVLKSQLVFQWLVKDVTNTLLPILNVMSSLIKGAVEDMDDSSEMYDSSELEDYYEMDYTSGIEDSLDYSFGMDNISGMDSSEFDGSSGNSSSSEMDDSSKKSDSSSQGYSADNYSANGDSPSVRYNSSSASDESVTASNYSSSTSDESASARDNSSYDREDLFANVDSYSALDQYSSVRDDSSSSGHDFSSGRNDTFSGRHDSSSVRDDPTSARDDAFFSGNDSSSARGESLSGGDEYSSSRDSLYVGSNSFNQVDSVEHDKRNNIENIKKLASVTDTSSTSIKELEMLIRRLKDHD